MGSRHSMGFPVPIWNDFKGGPQGGIDRIVFLGNRRWCTDRVPSNVKSVFIIYSRDESRVHFRPSDLQYKPPTRGHVRDHVVLPGDHSDNGGHIENNRNIARVALREMIRAARSVDVPVAEWGLITDHEIADAYAKKLMKPSKGYMNGDRLFWY